MKEGAVLSVEKIHCSRCSRTVEVQMAVTLNWRTEPKLEVQGKRIGLCGDCFMGADPLKPHEPGTCSGDYRSDGGEYWRAEVDDGREEEWSCWSRECVDKWLEEADIECFECGHERDYAMWHYVNGARKSVV